MGRGRRRIPAALVLADAAAATKKAEEETEKARIKAEADEAVRLKAEADAKVKPAPKTTAKGKTGGGSDPGAIATAAAGKI